MGRIINTFKNGSTKAKLYLALAFATALLSLGFVILSFVLSKLIFFFAAIVMAFISISIAQTFAIHEFDEDDSSNDENTIATTDVIPGDSGDSKESKKSKEKKFKEKKTKEKKVKEKDVKEKKVKEKKIKEKDVKEENKTKSGKKNSEKDISDDRIQKKLAEDTIEEAVIEHITEEDAKSLSKKQIKKTLHKYKVKREHRTVMIDHCDKFKIKQTPAYVWIDKNIFNILLIEKEPRQLTIPVYSLREMTYLKKQPGSPDVDYGIFKGSNILADIFGDYIPDYAHSTVMDDLTAYKNLYGIGPGIYFTNRSVKNIMDILPVEFVVEDKVTTSKKVNSFFKDTYKSNILLRDSVIDANGYADRISNILESMAKSSLSHNEFKETLNLMIKNKLITEEFASYYMGMRDKLGK